MIKVTVEKEKAYIQTPYNPVFVSEIRKIGDAKFDRNESVWVVPEEYLEDVREIMRMIYGEDDLGNKGEDRLDVKLTFVDSYFDEGSAIVLFGKIICSILSRDSGARLGEGVVLKDGKVDSSGSRKRPGVYIYAGTVLVIKNVDRMLYEKGLEELKAQKEEIIVEEMCSTGRDEDLRRERKRLVKRLEEIDALLAAAGGPED